MQCSSVPWVLLELRMNGEIGEIGEIGGIGEIGEICEIEYGEIW